MIDSEGADKFYGGNGDDNIIASNDNDRDVYKGGSGNDSLYFTNSLNPVNANLGTKKISITDQAKNRTSKNDTKPTYDRVTGIEAIYGSPYSDILIGDTQANLLDGSHGGDNLMGGKGKDQLIGGKGKNILDGGKGKDKAIFPGERQDYNISTHGGELIIKGRKENTTLISIEIIEFSDQTISAELL